MIKVTTQTRDTNTENGLEKATNLHVSVIFGGTLHKESIGKNDRNLGKRR